MERTRDDGGLRVNIALLSIMGFVLVPAMIVGLIAFLIGRQNHIADLERARQAESLLGFFAQAAEQTVRDNAMWDEAQRRIVFARDLDWFHETLGAEAYGSVEYDAAAAVDARGAVWAASWKDARTAWSPRAVLGPAFDAVLDGLVAQPGSTSASSYVRLGADLALFAIGEVSDTRGELSDPRMFEVLVYVFDDDRMARLRDSVGWSDLGVSEADPARSQIPVTDIRGEVVHHLSWQPPRPGTAALRETVPYLLITLLLGAVAMGGLRVRLIQTHERLEAAQREALRLAECDSLTGIANRRKLTASLEAALARGAPFQMLMIDFDGFKEINDRLGHPMGDALLKEMTARMQRLCPAGGMLARLGGDEFAVIHPGTPAEALEHGRDLVIAISAPFGIPGTRASRSPRASVSSRPSRSLSPSPSCAPRRCSTAPIWRSTRPRLRGPARCGSIIRASTSSPGCAPRSRPSCARRWRAASSGSPTSRSIRSPSAG